MTIPVAPAPQTPCGRMNLLRAIALFALASSCGAAAQQPKEPVDGSPIDGEAYYFLNQDTGMQMDLNAGSSASGDFIVEQPRSFTSLSQRWAMTKLSSGGWKISNLANGLCLDSASGSGAAAAVQNACSAAAATQEWSLKATTNGYETVANAGTGLALDLAGTAAGAHLVQTSLSPAPTQSQQWLLRPAFFRGVDNALLEKQEAERVANSVPWWTDAGQPQDVLQILKSHGGNMVRVRPTTTPPYDTYTSSSCAGNGCYAETDAADIDLAKRAKQLGMSVELTLLFDGGSSSAIPAAWSSDSLAQAKIDLYNYVKAEVEEFRSAGAMPDMVTIGNEVDTGFLGSLGSPTGSNFAPFAALQTQGMQAVLDASSDTAIGAALPPPIRCIHITPAWDLTSFFGLVNSNSIPYDAICQSYYPIYHGPLTTAQATAANPYNKPVEQTALTNAANAIGKPIFLIEVGEHYENGFSSNDPWYPATLAGQRQYLIDVDGVLKGLPNNLAMGMEYWDAAGDNLPASGGGYANGDGRTDAIYTWNGLTLFDNADGSGSSQSSAVNFSAALPGLDALGGKLDATLSYKLVNQASGQILEAALGSTAAGSALDTAPDTGVASLHQQWSIASNGDGYFQIANRNAAQGSAANVLDNGGSTAAGAVVTQDSAATGTPGQEWDILTAGGGYYALVNKASSLILASNGAGSAAAIEQEAPASAMPDWIIAADKTQLWRITPAHASASSAPAELLFAAGTPTALAAGASLGTLAVDVADSAGDTIGSPQQAVTLTIAGPAGFSQTASATSANGVASFDLSKTVLAQAGTYTLVAASSGLASATAAIVVAPSAKSSTATSLAVSATTVNAGQAVTFTATVAAAGGTPTGMVAFLSGATQLGASTLSASGSAAYATAALGAGADSITAAYQGDANFTASTSAAAIVTVVAPTPATFSLAAAPASLTVARGQSGTVALTVAPTGGYAGTIALSCGALPAGVSCAFTPASLAADGSNAVLSAKLVLSASAAAAVAAPPSQTEEAPSNPNGNGMPIVPASLLYISGFLGVLAIALQRRRLPRAANLLRMVSFAAACAGSALLAGCGGGASPATATPTTASVTVTAVGSTGSVSQSAQIALTLQ